MNKKAQIATFFLVLVAIALAITAAYSFLTFQNELNSNSDIASAVNDAEFYHNYVLAQAKLVAKETISACPACSSQQLKAKFKELSAWREEQYRLIEAGNFFGKIRNDEFNFTSNQDKYTLEIDNLFIQSEKVENKITRNFDVCFEFNNKKEFVRNCN